MGYLKLQFQIPQVFAKERFLIYQYFNMEIYTCQSIAHFFLGIINTK